MDLSIRNLKICQIIDIIITIFKTLGIRSYTQDRLGVVINMRNSFEHTIRYHSLII